MTEVAMAKVRKNLSDAVNRVAYGKERVVLTRRGKGFVAIVSMEDLALIDALENRIDLEEARKVLADTGDKAVPWAKAKKRLGL